jgi:hypothetical protein
LKRRQALQVELQGEIPAEAPLDCPDQRPGWVRVRGGLDAKLLAAAPQERVSIAGEQGEADPPVAIGDPEGPNHGIERRVPECVHPGPRGAADKLVRSFLSRSW